MSTHANESHDRTADDAAACVERLKVIADPTRLAVLRALRAGGQHVHELAGVLSVEQSLLSHHLRVLRDAGLVDAARDGKAVLYRLTPAVLVKKGDGAINLGCCSLTFE